MDLATYHMTVGQPHVIGEPFTSSPSPSTEHPMRPVIYVAVLLAALSAAIGSRHVPKNGVELRTFRKVSEAEFTVMREEAPRLVREGLVQEARYVGDRYFEISCHGAPLMLVDNSLEQLVIVLYSTRENDIPCVEPMLSHWSGRIVPE